MIFVMWSITPNYLVPNYLVIRSVCSFESGQDGLYVSDKNFHMFFFDNDSVRLWRIHEIWSFRKNTGIDWKLEFLTFPSPFTTAFLGAAVNVSARLGTNSIKFHIKVIFLFCSKLLNINWYYFKDFLAQGLRVGVWLVLRKYTLWTVMKDILSALY